jgi:hypothetical protein
MNICKVCEKEYSPRRDKVLTSKTCSSICKMKYLGTKSQEKLHKYWDSRSEEEEKSDLKQVYEKFVVKKVGCWSWNGAKKSKLPYGNLTFRGKELTAHRVSYELHIGKIPKGMSVLHRCDNAECSNPDHLFLGTYLDNKRDQIAKGRAIVEKLNVEKVREIKKMLRDGILHGIISKRYGISMTTVWCIQTGRTWKDIE